MENLLPLVPSEVLEQELQTARFVKQTDRGNNQIYVFSGLDCPYLMLQVGILREMAFRAGGGGTGLAIDIDEYDEFTHTDYPGPYPTIGFKQLIVWDPENKAIVGGYRYALMNDLLTSDYTSISSPTMHLFEANSIFLMFYAPFSIELGRSFVNPLYHTHRKAIFALDNLFEGLGTLVADYQEEHIQYFFGKVTMYKTYNRQARNMILYYMQKHFKDHQMLITPKKTLIPPGLHEEISFLEQIFVGNTEKEDKHILLRSLQEIKEGMPPLFKKYTEMSPSMKCFGTAINHYCGEVEETAILIEFASIVPEYKDRYISKYFHKKFGKYF
jgi:hypothetical protein